MGDSVMPTLNYCLYELFIDCLHHVFFNLHKMAGNIDVCFLMFSELFA